MLNLKVQSLNNRFSFPDEKKIANVSNPKNAIHRVGKKILSTNVRLELTLILMNFPLIG